MVVPALAAVPVVVLRVVASVRRAPEAGVQARAMAPRARVVGVLVRVRGMAPRARVVGVLVRVRGMGPRAQVAAVRGQRVLVTAPLRATARGLVRRVQVLRVRLLKGRRVAVVAGVVRPGVGVVTPAIRGAVVGGIRGAVMVGRRWRRVPLMVRVRRGSRRRVRRLMSPGRRVVVGSRSRVTRARPVVCSGRAAGQVRATARRAMAQRAMVIRVRVGGRCSAGQVTGVVRVGRRGTAGRRRVRMRRRRV